MHQLLLPQIMPQGFASVKAVQLQQHFMQQAHSLAGSPCCVLLVECSNAAAGPTAAAALCAAS